MVIFTFWSDPFLFIYDLLKRLIFPLVRGGAVGGGRGGRRMPGLETNTVRRKAAWGGRGAEGPAAVEDGEGSSRGGRRGRPVAQ